MPNLNIQAIISAKNQASAALASFRGGLLDVATVLAPIAAGLAAVSIAVTEVTKRAIAQENADVKLANSLRTVGQNTKSVRDDLAKFTASLEDATAVSDESIQEVEALFAQLGRLSGDALKRATRAALDYAAATGQDVYSAAIAMNNVIAKGQGRLAGIDTKFDDTASRGERFAQVLDQIESNMGGTAGVMGKTLGAAFTRIGNDFDNFLQSLGESVVKSQAFRDILGKISEGLKTASHWVETHRADVDSWTRTLLNAGISAGEFVVTLIDMAAKVAKIDIEIRKLSGSIFGASKYGEAVGALDQALIDTAEKAVPALKQSLEGLRKTLASTSGNTVDVADDLNDLPGPAKAGADAVDELSDAFKTLGMEGFDEAIKKAAALDRVTEELEKQFAAGKIPVERYNALKKELQDVAVKLAEAGVSMKEWNITIEKDTEGALDVLGIKIGEVIKQAAAFPQATADLQEFADAGLLSSRQFSVNMADLFNMADQMRLVGVAIETGFTNAQELAIQVGTAIQDWGINSALAFGDALVDAARTGKQAFADFARSVLADLLKILLRMAIIKLIAIALGAAAGGPGGAAIAGGIDIGGGVVAMASGGIVTGGTRGRDSVAALLTPGEVVLPNRTFEDVATIAAYARQAMGAPGTGVAATPGTGPMNLTINFDRRNRDAEVADMIRDITRAVERHGYRLVASEVA